METLTIGTKLAFNENEFMEKDIAEDLNKLAGIDMPKENLENQLKVRGKKGINLEKDTGLKLKEKKGENKYLSEELPTGQTLGQDCWPASLIKKLGEPLRYAGARLIGFNEQFWGAWLSEELDIKTDDGNNVTRVYNEEAQGCWQSDEEELLCMIQKFITKEALKRGMGREIGQHNTTRNIKSIIPYLIKHSKEENPFTYFHHEWKILCNNGVIEISDDPEENPKFIERGWTKDDRWINSSPIDYIEGATCPKILDILKIGLKDNQELIGQIQMLAGQTLLGHNYHAKVGLWWGKPNSGKTIFLKLLSQLINVKNVEVLRTQHVGGRFETHAYKDATLLTASEVGQILNSSQGISYLKAIVGGDWQTAESKGSDRREKYEGNKNVVIMKNGEFLLHLENDDDVGAMKRRLIPLYWAGSKPDDEDDTRLVRKLMKEEGSGFLNWVIEGAKKVKNLTLSCKAWQLPEDILNNIEYIVASSDGVGSFLKLCIVKSEGEHISSTGIWDAYQIFCDERAIPILTHKDFNIQLIEKMRIYHNSARGNSIIENGKHLRGFRNVGFKKIPVRTPERLEIGILNEVLYDREKE